MSSIRDNIYEQRRENISPFEFNKETVDVFDDMAKRSIPGYEQMQETIAAFAKEFYVNNTNIYDAGCSTGNTLLNISKQLPSYSKIIAFDNSEEMVMQAKEKCAHLENIDFKVADLDKFDFENASFITCIYVLQFVEPKKRYDILKKMYDGLKDGGLLILSEKLVDTNPRIQAMTNKLYYDYKAKRGYSETEIKQKEKALEGVLRPFDMETYKKMFADIGFSKVTIFLKYFNFTGFALLK